WAPGPATARQRPRRSSASARSKCHGRSHGRTEMPTAPRPEIDKDAFFEQLGFAARTFGTNRDYLYAVAVVESGVRNIQSPASPAFGPFQFLPPTWKDLVTRFGADTGVTQADI